MILPITANENRSYPQSDYLKGGQTNYMYALKASYTCGFVAGAYSATHFQKNIEENQIDYEEETCKDISIVEAKANIKAFFEKHHGETIDYVDLLNEFDYSLTLIVAACEELESEGEIGGIN